MHIEKFDTFEVDELFESEVELYNFFTWGKFEGNTGCTELKNGIEKVFNNYSRNRAVSMKHCRLIWKSQK
jgi:hypothetical protein